MRRLFTTLTLLSLCATTLVAQKIDGYFVSRSMGESTTYFLLPQELFANADGDKLSHDITVMRDNVTDSARMNFTYKRESPTPIDSIAINSKSTSIKGVVKRLYIEPTTKSGNWTHRYCFSATMSDFATLYNVDSPASITLYSDGKTIEYVCREGEWQKYAPIGARIFTMIRLN